MSMSHVAARQEVRALLAAIGLPEAAAGLSPVSDSAADPAENPAAQPAHPGSP
jgi:hypothetical protein